LTSWDKISQIDASHFERGAAYVAVNAIRKDDMQAHIFRTHDFGRTWEEIVTGMEGSGPVNVVREDVKQQGLLFAGTEREVYFSYNDGDSWQSLRLNMPASSIRDLVVHNNDLVIGTHGRSIWILDNFIPLRELKDASSEKVHLFKPSMATRVRFNMFSDTPFPPEEPTGQNPPDGAIIDYMLTAVANRVTLEIQDQQEHIIAKFSSEDKVEELDSTKFQHPTYWLRPPPQLSTTLGHHRFIWNLRYQTPHGANRAFSIAAVIHDTPSDPVGPFVHPGNYVVRLTVDGKVQEHNIEVRLDPRSKINEKSLQKQTQGALQCYNNYNILQDIRESIDRKLNSQTIWKKGKKEVLEAFRGQGNPSGADIVYSSISETTLDKETVVGIQEKFLFVMELLQSADDEPTTQNMKALEILDNRLKEMIAKWNQLH
jgi:hypothetical protein